MLKVVLYLGAVYYLIGAIAHYFALTIFPWFVSGLYAPYQDTVIAFVAIMITCLLVFIAKDPVKHRDMLKAVIIGAIAAPIFSILVISKVNFVALGVPGKGTQTIVESILGFMYSGILIWLYPRGEEPVNPLGK